jgi:hypothetical protein
MKIRVNTLLMVGVAFLGGLEECFRDYEKENCGIENIAFSYGSERDGRFDSSPSHRNDLLLVSMRLA